MLHLLPPFHEHTQRRHKQPEQSQRVEEPSMLLLPHPTLLPKAGLAPAAAADAHTCALLRWPALGRGDACDFVATSQLLAF